MLRFLLAFAFALTLAAPAAAQLPSPTLVAREASNWVKVTTNENGDIWMDANSIVASDGYYRSAWFRMDRNDGTRHNDLLQFDCDGGIVRAMAENGGLRTPIGEWMRFSEDRNAEITGTSMMREKICGWR